MATYERIVDFAHSTITFAQTEKHNLSREAMRNGIYGSKRLGVMTANIPMLGSQNNSYSQATWTHTIGQRVYELTNHLGNVLSTVTDKPIPVASSTTVGTLLSYFVSDIQQSTAYSAFGVQLNAHNLKKATLTKDFRYGFNGMEEDDEIKGDGNSVNYGERLMDPRLGRWLRRDNLESKYPETSPYAFALNNPILFSDKDGNDVIINTTTSSYDGKNPSKVGDVGVTQGSYDLVYDQSKNQWNLVLDNHIEYSKAFKNKGKNGKTLEEENPGLLKAAQTHEGVHVERNIQAMKTSIKYTTNLLSGGPQIFEGTADVVMQQIFDKFMTERQAKLDEMLMAKEKELSEKYQPLFEKAKDDATQTELLIKQKQEEEMAFINTEVTSFNQETITKVFQLKSAILSYVSQNVTKLNKHEGENGVVKTTAKKLTKGSSSYGYQDGTKTPTWQGVQLTK